MGVGDGEKVEEFGFSDGEKEGADGERREGVDESL
jgi:hypothetical protein